MGIGRRDAEHMRRMRARRRPFTAPRAGRLLSQIEFATALPTSELVRCCFPVEHMWGEIKSWHRTSVIRAARLVATPIGRASTRGRPLLWQAIPERMKRAGHNGAKDRIFRRGASSLHRTAHSMRYRYAHRPTLPLSTGPRGPEMAQKGFPRGCWGSLAGSPGLVQVAS
jgi:hypothetical protein